MDEPKRGDGPDAGGAGNAVPSAPSDRDVAMNGPTAPSGGTGSGADPGPDAAPEAAGAEPGTALPGRVEAWRRRSAAGAILTGFALGLQEALETHREEPSIVVQTSGDPPDDLPVEAEFEYGRPRQSVVSIRPWMLKESRREGDDRPAGDS